MRLFKALAAMALGAVMTASGAIAATPAMAVPATTDAEATVEIRKGLTLDSAQNLDLGIVVLSGTAPFSADVSIDRDGTFSCDGASGDVTCSGSPQEARYDVTGSAGYVVDIDDNQIAAGTGLTVGVDMGSGAGLAVGNVVTVYRQGDKSDPVTRRPMGAAVVVAVRENFSVARVVYAREEVHVGDRVISRVTTPRYLVFGDHDREVRIGARIPRDEIDEFHVRIRR